jgi:cell division transport system permease protein
MRFLRQTLRNALENIFRNKLVNILCLGIIAFALLVLGIFQFISFNLDRYIGKLSESVEVIFYLHDRVAAPDAEKLLRTIQESLLVREVTYTSREQAEVNFSQEFPELKYILTEFADSPFPPSINVRFKPDVRVETQVESFVRDLRQHPLVESVQLNLDWARKIGVIKKFISLVGFFLSFILVFVSVFIIFNVIKLNIFYRRDEINILKLVGGTNWYIRTPFLIEGTILGLLGGCLSSLLLMVVLKIFPLYAGFVFDLVRQMIDFQNVPLNLYVRLVGIGALIGFLSSALSLKQFLKFRPK